MACTGGNESTGAVSHFESTDRVEELVQNTPLLKMDEFPPERFSAKTKEMVDAIAAGKVAFTQFKGCHIADSVEGDAPKGQFLYAWNEASTVGLVLSIHHPPLTKIPMGTQHTLSVTERDAFIMIEIGEDVDANFCVPDIKQIPISTVLESQTGRFQITMTEKGVEANIGPILFRDQYTNLEVSFNGVVIPAQKLVSL